MAAVCVKIGHAMAACALGLALIGAHQTRAQEPPAQPPELNRTDLAPAALQRADALIEKYVLPVAAQEPTPQQKSAIEAAMKLLKSEQAMRGQIAIERFLRIGPPALGELRRLAATAPPENATGEPPTADTYPSTMAAIIIRRIETAYRQPMVEELISLGNDARAVLSMKFDENEAAETAAQSRVDAATAALVKASANTTVDDPAVAAERGALARAQAAEKQVQARHDMLIELKRLLAPKPPVPPEAQPQPQPTTPPPDVTRIQPISPPTGSPSSTPMQSNSWPYNSDWPPYVYPPFVFTSPVIVPQRPPSPPVHPKH